jgi:nicotinic acid mononucleotide adenylyltransferase
MQGAAFLQDADLQTLRFRELSAIKSFADNTATLQEWRDVEALHSLCEIMAVKGCGAEALPVTEKAQSILQNLAENYEHGVGMGITPDELTVFHDLYEFHDLQRTSVCRLEYENYIELAANHKQSKSYLVKEIT